MLGGQGREGLGEDHGFPLDEQKKKDRCENQPYFRKHYFTPAFNLPGLKPSAAKAQPKVPIGIPLFNYTTPKPGGKANRANRVIPTGLMKIFLRGNSRIARAGFIRTEEIGWKKGISPVGFRKSAVGDSAIFCG
jgi:hypothetical protein